MPEGGMESPESCSAGPQATVFGAGEKEREGLVSLVDPFLVEALENPRHRLTVLRMELDIQRFVQNSDVHQFEFQHYPTSYLKRCAHRVAQHYGLQTMALDNSIDGQGSRVIARKTPSSRFPAVFLSDIPAQQTEKVTSGQVKIAIRQRPRGASSSDAAELVKNGGMRSMEERKEEYDRARARIFNGSNNSVAEWSPSFPSSESKNVYAIREDQESQKATEQIIRTSKDGGYSIAIFRDREKDRTDPDYDRSYERYVRGLTLGQNFGMGSHTVLHPPFPQYEAGISQFGGHLARNQSPGNYMSKPDVNPFTATGSNQTFKNSVYMQWPTPAMMYANSYEHMRHAIFQAPFYQQPLSFEHTRKC
ncbi:uncharacterized protein [Typha latifolia]|uniref:uncharacterized protein n=1 Tax=Typha latifolia TaxID=4733 RepID=UPI003C2CAF07